MKRKIAIAVVVVTLMSFGVAQVSAQAELTLESIAEQLVSLIERVEALESIWEGPGSLPLTEPEGACVVATGELQRETALKFYDQFDRFPENIRIHSVVVFPPADGTSVTYTEGWGDEYYARERWVNCEFSESTDWVDRTQR